MVSCVDVCVQGPRRSTNRDECTYTQCPRTSRVCVCLCVLLLVTGALCTARTCPPCHERRRLRMGGILCMAACCWGPRDHCLPTCRHTQTPSPCVGREGRPRVGGVMRCCCCCCLLSFCCVASCLMPVVFLLLLLHRWPRCCPARHIEACRGWSGWVRLLHP